MGMPRECCSRIIINPVLVYFRVCVVPIVNKWAKTVSSLQWLKSPSPSMILAESGDEASRSLTLEAIIIPSSTDISLRGHRGDQHKHLIELSWQINWLEPTTHEQFIVWRACSVLYGPPPPRDLPEAGICCSTTPHLHCPVFHCEAKNIQYS